ncbi:MAG: sensor histidine kinase [Bacteroidota bacterium]
MENQNLPTKGIKTIHFSSHFLFNSLNVVQHYIISDDRKAALSSLNMFSSFFRQYILLVNNEVISVEDEVNLLRIYLKMQELRYSDKLVVNLHCCDHVPLNRKIPSFLLAVIVEDYMENLLQKGKGDPELKVHLSTDCGFLKIIIEAGGFGSPVYSTGNGSFSPFPSGELWRKYIHSINLQRKVPVQYLEEKVHNHCLPFCHLRRLSLKIPFED